MKSKFSNDTGKMLSKYMEVLQNIDNNNPKLIDKMFNPNNLPLKPLTNTGVAATAAAGLPQTAESEENKSLQEATK